MSAAQLYARHALVLDDDGRDLGESAWHESDLVQRLPGGRAWYVVDARALRQRVRERTVADLVEAARAAGGDVRPAEELPFARTGVAEARRASLRGDPRVRSRDAHDRRPPHRRARPRARRRRRARPRPASPRAPTRAASSPAATAAASPPLSSSAASPPRPLSPDDEPSAWDVSGPGPDMYGTDGGQASWVYAQRRRSPGSGDGPSFVDLQRLLVSLDGLPRSPAARPRAAPASSRRATRRRGRSPRCPGCRSRRTAADSSCAGGFACVRGSTTWIAVPPSSPCSTEKRPLSVEARSPIESREAVRRSPVPSSATIVSISPCRGVPDRDRDPRRRPAPHRLVQRLADDLVEPDLLLLAEALGSRDVDLDLDLMLEPELAGELVDRRAEALVAQHDRLDVEREVAEGADRLAVALERGHHDPAGGLRAGRRRSPARLRRASARSRRGSGPARRGGRARGAAARPARR